MLKVNAKIVHLSVPRDEDLGLQNGSFDEIDDPAMDPVRSSSSMLDLAPTKCLWQAGGE